MHRPWFVVLVVFFAAIAAVADDDRPPLSSGIGSAVLIAGNSIQLDRDVAVRTGDIIVNRAATGRVLGEYDLSLDQGVITGAAYKIAANRVDIDRGAVVRGDVWYNLLRNDGTINGQKIKPLALPVFATLPPVVDRTAGVQDVIVAEGATVTLAEGDYGKLVAGKASRVNFSGGGYTFTAINAARGAMLRFAAPSDVVVRGRLALEAYTFVGPSNAHLTAASILFHVNGINGTDGAVRSTPFAASLGQASTISANMHVSAGTLMFDQKCIATGAFLARDILVGRGSRISIASGWNGAPTADPQTITTNGATPRVIHLTGSDPEDAPLTFSIVSDPVNGTLSAISGANVTYTPSTAANLPDAFTFRVTDPAGASGDAVVTINPPRADPPPPPVTHVIADDLSAPVVGDTPTVLLLTARAPEAATLTFTTTGVGPFHGSLGSITPVSGKPHMAMVLYTPDNGYVGSDSFDFRACNGADCDTATFSITVLEHRTEPGRIASDVNVSAVAGQESWISLGSTSTLARRFNVRANAAMLAPAEVAGNVADANGDGIGDNHNALPGGAPVFMSAGIGQSGGAGSNGTTRMDFEWDISNLAASASSLVSADVILHTHRGTTDSADTRFYWIGGGNDGVLTDADYARPGERLSGVVMIVPPSMAIGEDGTFSFSVIGPLRDAIKLGFDHFTIQGRVDELQQGAVRGLEVRTTADGNVSGFVMPQLALATPGITPPLTYTILTLPLHGTLRDASNTPITNVPFTLTNATVAYTPFQSFLGNDAFTFSATNGLIVAEATAHIHVSLIDCATDPRGCDDGR